MCFWLACFCFSCDNPKAYDCQFDGLLYMGPCFFDTPLYFSRGNFKGVDRRIKGTVQTEALLANQTADKQSFYIEPVSKGPSKSTNNINRSL